TDTAIVNITADSHAHPRDQRRILCKGRVDSGSVRAAQLSLHPSPQICRQRFSTHDFSGVGRAVETQEPAKMGKKDKVTATLGLENVLHDKTYPVFIQCPIHETQPEQFPGVAANFSARFHSSSPAFLTP